MKETKLSTAQVEKELASKRQTGQWRNVFARVKKGESLKLEGLTRGQVAACYRGAKEAGILYRTNYKEGYIVLAPATVAP